MEGKPIFEDEYMFDKVTKQYTTKLIDDSEIYLIDWNENQSFIDINEDYIGVKMSTENRPTIDVLVEENYITINGKSYLLSIEENDFVLEKFDTSVSTNLNTLNTYFPIELTSGELLNPKFNVDTTIIYFWATWCKPCVETIKNVTPQLDELAANNIEFIPVAHDCGTCKEYLQENSMPYKYYHITEDHAKKVNIQFLSKQLTFLEDKSLAQKNTRLKNYYH